MNNLGIKISNLILKKKSNLCLSLDVINKELFLKILEETAQYICILKTHINTVNDFDYEFILKILEIQEKYEFFIMEDGKFSDIGNTFRNQLTEGIFKINNWADCITCHGIAGESILKEYKDIQNDNIFPKGIFLVGQMSNKGNLIDESYTNNIIKLAKFNDTIIGFITQKNLNIPNKNYLYLTPGVSLQNKEDNKDQQYRTIEQAIIRDNCDIIIVGRGIINSENPQKTAEIYQKEAWKNFISKKSNQY